MHCKHLINKLKKMKIRGKLYIATVLVFFLQLFLLSAENALTGNKLCNEIYNYYSKKHLKVIIQGLSSSDLNEYPYNIILNPVTADYDTSLIYIFTAEDCIEHLEVITKLYSRLETQPYNSAILISYGENIFIPDNFPVKGSNVFFNDLNTNQDLTIINVRLSAEKNNISNGCNGFASPAWLTKAALNSYGTNNLTSDLYFYYISQLAQFTFNNDSILYQFLSNSIPAITVNFNKDNTNQLQISDTLCTLADEFSLIEDHSNDTHYLIIRLFNKVLLFSEYLIIQIISFILFISVGFIFILGLINKKLQNEGWKEIKKNWYTIPVTFILSVLSFYAGKAIYLAWNIYFEATSAFGIVILQISIALFTNSVFYLLETFFHRSYGERSIDFLLIISTFINQFILSVTDISLFPLYMSICVVAILSIIFKRNYWHIILLVLMFVIYFSYINKLYVLSDTLMLREFLFHNHFIYFAIPLSLIPVNIMWLRILTAVKKKYVHNRRLITILLSSVFTFIVLVLSLVNHFHYNDKSIIADISQIVIEDCETQDRTSVVCSENRIFDDTIRTLNITTTEPAAFIQVLVAADQKNPVQYSASDYILIDNYTSEFIIPVYPPENLSFSYGTESIENQITVKAWYKESEQTYHVETILLTAGGENQ